MTNKSPQVYTIPARFRSLENLHVLFWLIKDVCWCIGLKPIGTLMILPTLSVAIYFMWKNRKIISEFAHNLAIIFWITANSMWMIFEFTETDDLYKNYCLIPFFAGLIILFYYYLVYAPMQKRRMRAQIEVEPVE